MKKRIECRDPQKRTMAWFEFAKTKTPEVITVPSKCVAGSLSSSSEQRTGGANEWHCLKPLLPYFVALFASVPSVVPSGSGCLSVVTGNGPDRLNHAQAFAMTFSGSSCLYIG
jgi:hypothetical protein